MFERELFGELGIHQLLLAERVHGREHALGPRGAVDHQHSHAFLRSHLMRYAWWNVNAGSLLGTEYIFTDLKICAAFEYVERFVGLDVIVRPRLKSGLAILFHDFECLRSVGAGDLDNPLVRLRVNIALARR